VAFASQPPLKPNVRGARWNPKDVSALYMSLSEATARSEFAYVLRSQPVPPAVSLASHAINVRLTRTIELDANCLIELGIDIIRLPDGITGWTPCQEVGGAVAFLGIEGLIVPSVRHASGRNLVAYTDEIAPPGSSYELAHSANLSVDDLDV
jgi:RES domain-containing protein